MAETIEIAAHFDGERIVLDEPFQIPVGATLKVRVVESDGERKARALDALDRLAELGRHSSPLIPPSLYIEDRDDYYYRDHVHTGIDHDPSEAA